MFAVIIIVQADACLYGVDWDGPFPNAQVESVEVLVVDCQKCFNVTGWHNRMNDNNKCT